ncbi:ABC transporter substrate-binding protein [Enterovirga rhinocerotis]|uniref:Amino acid/amide ABC transporter substrate-binding protein (HAAT family) n=1 Tax=Enterovirga rhinocerotis TaxID=1339210 RepID=A0A4R7C7U5_9HYPH|nr:ABC transporter substrate-binding protein [Enterovirga rhinocerotis]TDR92896.1 amino acid/amide ABC transporter substrate-binding protein (HAAT family) [Enterovirga rhinocerotis]
MRYATMSGVTGVLAALLAAPASAAEPLRIGVHASFSGAAAIFAQGMQSAGELAAEDVKSAGGLKIGGKTYEITLKAYDDKYKAQDAVTTMDRLIHEDNIRFVIGPLGSAAAVATRQKTSDAKVMTFTMAFSHRALGAEAPYAFRPVVTTGEFTDAQLDWVLKQAPVKKVRALLPNDETGQQMGAAGQKAYRSRGVTLDVDYFERERVDFVPLLTRVLPQADALEIGGVAPLTTGLIIKQARELGYKNPIFITGGDVTAEVVKVAGKQATEGVYIHIPLDPKRPETAAFIARYTKKYGHAPNGFTPFFYAAMQMLLQSIRNVDSVEDTGRIAKELASLKDFPTVLGRARWSGEKAYGINHQIDLPFYVGQIRNGEAVTMATCDPAACR